MMGERRSEEDFGTTGELEMLATMVPLLEQMVLYQGAEQVQPIKDRLDNTAAPPDPASLVWLALSRGLRFAARFGPHEQIFRHKLNLLALSALQNGAGPQHVREAFECLMLAEAHAPKRRGRPRKAMPYGGGLVEFVREFPKVARQYGESIENVKRLGVRILHEAHPHSERDKHRKAVERVWKALQKERIALLARLLLQPKADK